MKKRVACAILSLLSSILLFAGCTAHGTAKDLLSMSDEAMMGVLYDHGLEVPESYVGDKNLVALIREQVALLEEQPECYRLYNYTELAMLCYAVKQAAWSYYGREFVPDLSLETEIGSNNRKKQTARLVE